MVSKYTKELEIEPNVYAIFNSLLLEPVYVTKKIRDAIFNGDISVLSSEEELKLKDLGILIDNAQTDEILYNNLYETYKEIMDKRISLMYLIPTNSCNLQCKYCFIGKLNEAPNFMDEGTALTAVEKFNDHLKKNDQQGTLFFYGAEPLLNFSLIKKVVKYIKEKNYNIEFAMVSNGLLITDNIAKFIKEHNISLGISIDGMKNVNDKNRIFKNSEEGSYDYVTNKINLLKTNNVDFGLSITVSKDLLKEKAKVLEWLKDLNVKNISYNLLHFTEFDPDWKKYYEEATEFIYNSNNTLYEYGFNEDRANRKLKSFYERKFKFSDCGAVGGSQITICPNGDIEICHGYWNRKNNKISNINNIKSLEEIFETEQYKEWNNNITLKKEECLKCEAIYICGRGCPKQSKELFGDENKIDEAFCVYSKKFLHYILADNYNDSKN